MLAVSPSRASHGFVAWVFAATFSIANPSPAPVFADDDVVIGAQGEQGAQGANGPSGANGGNGQPGEDATASANDPADSPNNASATGGGGGHGGLGGDAQLPGGSGGNGGNGAPGGNANATATATAPAGLVSATVAAYGGDGGHGGAGGNHFFGGHGLPGLPANGGNAHAAASASNSQPGGAARATATVVGGQGGSTQIAYPTQSLNGGHGGTATIGAIFASANNGSARAEATVIGGDGGHVNTDGDNAGIGGNGAPVTLVNRVSGSTTGSLYMSQTATGGSAGNGAQSGQPGTAGAASSSLTTTDTLASSLVGYAVAWGGNGGLSSSPEPASSGAHATSMIDITGKGSVQSNAESYGGLGGLANGSPLGGIGGNATATARGVSTMTGAVTVNAIAFAGDGGFGPTPGAGGLGSSTADAISVHGYPATALAEANGSNATVTARSRTAGGPISSILVTGTATNHVRLKAQTISAVGSNLWFFPPTGDASGNTDGLPSQATVTNALDGDPIVTAAYNASGPNHTPLALLRLQLNRPDGAAGATPTLKVTADYSFDLGMLPAGNLLVGLLDPASSGPAFSSLRFTIKREGATVEDQTFLTQAAATAYFDDHILYLGDIDTGVTGTLDLSFSLEMSSPNNGTSFNTTLLVADVGPDILPGDYNNDGKTDAADYVVWRKHEGSMTILPNDPHGGTIGATQFNTWRANFGKTFVPVPPGGGAGGNAAVPEPTTFAMLILAAVGLYARQRAARL
jgi:hypothetical protein